MRHFRSSLTSINALALDSSTMCVWGAAANRIFIWSHGGTIKLLHSLLAVDDDQRSVSALLAVADAYSVPATASSSVQHVVWASSADEIVVWTSECQRIQELNVGLPVVSMLQVGPSVLVASLSSLVLVDIASFSRVARWDAHTQRITTTAAAADFVFSGARDKLICVWRTDAPPSLAASASAVGAGVLPGSAVAAALSTSSSGALSPRGASSSPGGAARLVKALRRHKKRVRALAAVPQLDDTARRVAVWSTADDRSLVLWDAVKLEERNVLNDVGVTLSHLVALPADADGTHCVVGAVDDRTSLLLAAAGAGASAMFRSFKQHVDHEWSDPIPTKAVRCSFCLKKVRDEVTFCLVCEACVHSECTDHVRSACTGAPSISAPDHKHRLETHVLLSPRANNTSPRTPPTTDLAAALAASGAGGSVASSVKNATMLTQSEALVLARDFAARYVGFVRRLDTTQMRSLHRLVGSIMGGSGVRELFVTLRSGQLRVDARLLKRFLVEALLPLRRDLAVQGIMSYAVPLQKLSYRVYCTAVQGGREYMEDRFTIVEHAHELHGVTAAVPNTVFFGVFDGHEGSRAAQYAVSQLLANIVSHRLYATDLGVAIAQGFIDTDRAFNDLAKIGGFSDGTTATCVLLRDERLVCAWVGDTEALLFRSGRGRLLTRRHTPERRDEAERVVDAGGNVSSHAPYRVNQSLAITRSIGDRELANVVIAQPELVDMPISPEDEWLLIGTDGLFDVFDTDELATIVQRWVKTHERATVCQALVDEALRRNSTDNVTAMIVFFDANNPAAVPKTS